MIQINVVIFDKCSLHPYSFHTIASRLFVSARVHIHIFWLYFICSVVVSGYIVDFCNLRGNVFLP